MTAICGKVLREAREGAGSKDFRGSRSNGGKEPFSVREGLREARGKRKFKRKNQRKARLGARMSVHLRVARTVPVSSKRKQK